MSEQQEFIASIINELAAQVMVLEPGDLMAYGDVLTRLEQLAVVAEGGEYDALAKLGESLKSLLEDMILGERDDQAGGVDILTRGVTLGQEVLRGGASADEVGRFLAEAGLAEAPPPPPPPAAPPAPAAPAPGKPPPHPRPPPPPHPPPPPEPAPQEEAPAEAEAAPGEEPPAEAAPTPEQEAPAPAEEPAPAAPPEVQEEEPFSSEDDELLNEFVAEALEHLESIEVNTLVLEDTPEDEESLNAVFRPFHTIKGVSGFLNLGDINHLAHALENLLDSARSGKLILSSEAIDVILAGVDVLRQMINESQAAAAERRARAKFDTTGLEARIDAVLAGSAAPEPEGKGAPPLGEILVERGVPPEAVQEALEAQQEGVRRRPLGEIMVNRGSAEPAQVAEGLKTQKAMATSAGRPPAAQEVKIDTIKLDNLLDMVGELVIAGSMVRANPKVRAISDRKLMADLGQLSRITAELQKTTMAMRMVPIKQTFQKMVRVVRDTAKKKGRKVRLELEGEGTEIDRNMVEKFYEPLVHMVRNSVDHGIESAAEREAAGKPEEGTVVLAAYHKGGNVCIEIRDDGSGLNRDRIIAKAVEKEIIAPEDAEGMSDDEAFHLIFAPGFSTADQVTEISGRGVGMDVVQRTITELRGKVEIKSTQGQGSSFIIALPLTLAIIDGMVVEVGDERFILPTISVAESLRPHKDDYGTVQGRGEMIMIRGSLVPLVRLHQIVGVEPEHRQPWEGLVVVVEHHGQRRCLMVDRLVGRQEVVIKSLGESLKEVKVVAGGAIMGDGRVGLILDVEGVFRNNEGRRS